MNERLPGPIESPTKPEIELPEGYVWRREMQWSCPLHDEPLDYHECDCPYCTVGYGCDTCDVAGYEPTGWWAASYDFTGLTQVIKELYVPQIMEQLNGEILMGSLLSERIHEDPNGPSRAADRRVPEGQQDQAEESR
jgi:hypothetical protein